MAKRKNTLLSDLFPELAAEREVAEEEEREREEEEPARKVQKTSRKQEPRGNAVRNEEKWNARLEVCKEWKQAKGRFPKRNPKDKEEWSLYTWLQKCKPGGQNWTQARWEKLNEAFGEGWEKECFPCLETGTWRFQPGHQHTPRDESQWDAILEAVKEFKRTHGRFPRCNRGDADEMRLYQWLRDNIKPTSGVYTQERARRLDEELNPLSKIGNWRWETFTGKYQPEILAAARNLAAQNPASAQRGTAVPDDLAIGPNQVAQDCYLETLEDIN